MNEFLSIDIETTGLDREKSQILQIAMIWDDGTGRSLEDLPVFNVIIDNGPITYGEPYALFMNAKLIESIAKKEPMHVPCYAPIMNLPAARAAFHEFVAGLNGGKPVFIAGKNAAGFDVPILKNNGFTTHMFKHRVYDPGSMYAVDFGYPPSLDEINNLFQRPKVSHNAVEDALDVIAAIRCKLNE